MGVARTISPQAGCGRVGEAGLGPSCGDDGAGFDDASTRRNATVATREPTHGAPSR